MATGNEPFRIFISHKHDDHDAAHAISEALRTLDSQIRCFVSGTHLVAGTDWNAEIRSQLSASHLLILVFTEPTKNWDWCLYEAGLFTSLSDEEHSVVCLHHPGGASPRPLKSLQSVPVEKDKLVSLLRSLCTETWRVAKKWRYGAIGAGVQDKRLADIAEAVVAAFPQPAAVATAPVHLTHYPCHRVVLDLRGLDGAFDRIPDAARVVEGEGATSTYTLSLFNFTRGQTSRSWNDLVAATGEPSGLWLEHLNTRYAAAIREKLFSPALITPMPVGDPYGGTHRRNYRPMLYEIQRAPAPSVSSGGYKSLVPVQLTLVLDPVADNTYPPPPSAAAPAPG